RERAAGTGPTPPRRRALRARESRRRPDEPRDALAWKPGRPRRGWWAAFEPSHSTTGGAASPPAPLPPLLARERLHLSPQRGAGPDERRLPAVAVGDLGRAVDLRAATHLHQLQRFGPAWDHTVERKLCRLVAIVRAVELGAVAQRAAVVHLDAIGRARRGA